MLSAAKPETVASNIICGIRCIVHHLLVTNISYFIVIVNPSLEKTLFFSRLQLVLPNHDTIMVSNSVVIQM